MAVSVTLPGLAPGDDSDRTRIGVRQLAQQVASLATLDSPVFTGNPQAPTPATADNDTSVATTAFVKAQGYLTSAPVTSVAGKTGVVTLASGDVAGDAPLASPTFTGIPKAPTASAGNNSTQLATTAYVDGAGASNAPLASPAFTGNPTAPTQASGNNSTRLATTAYADAAAPWKSVKKTADQSITSSTTFADDSALQFPMAANATYAVRFFYFVNAGAGGGKIAVNGPASPGSIRFVGGSFFGASGSVAITAYNTTIGSNNASSNTAMYIIGRVTNGATAGTFAIRIAQTTSSAAATVFEAGAWLEYQQIS